MTLVIITNGSKASLLKMMNFLVQYESESRHLINKQKSCFLLGNKTSADRSSLVAQCTGFSQKSFPIKYLGCNLFNGRKRIHYFHDLIDNVEGKLAGWKAKLLSHGGRLVLIRHVLQSIPIHILAAFAPPKTILHKIDMLFANFFGGHNDEGFKCHWFKWSQCCFPTQEGGIGIRRMVDVSNAFTFKNWWALKSSKSLGACFIKANYDHFLKSNLRVGYGSSILKRMMQVLSSAEQHITWVIGQDDINFWSERWLGDLQLADMVTPPSSLASLSVKQVLSNDNNALFQCQAFLPNSVQRKLEEWRCRLSMDTDHVCGLQRPMANFQ